MSKVKITYQSYPPNSLVTLTWNSAFVRVTDSWIVLMEEDNDFYSIVKRIPASRVYEITHTDSEEVEDA